jgi:F5/8 type C domain
MKVPLHAAKAELGPACVLGRAALRALTLLLIPALVLALVLATTAHAQDRVLDDFNTLAGWTLTATDDVKATLRSSDAPQGKALCIDFDFGHVTGYVAARRDLQMELPERYEFTLGVRGSSAPNALQFKLIDSSGENVWWYQRPEFKFPSERQALRIRQRQIQFAWGPSTDHALHRIATIELVIASGSGAGKGSACFDRLTLRELPPVEPPTPTPQAQAGSALSGHEAKLAIDGKLGTDWQPPLSHGGAAQLTIDYGESRELGALALHWRAGAQASRYSIALSDDGQRWRDVRRIDHALGEVQVQWLPELEARYVRIALDEPTSRAVALAEVELRDTANANAFFERLAKDTVRGRYPRSYVGEQSYWTVFGVDGAPVASLMNEDGVVEPVPGVGAVEPFLVVDGKLITWADARISHSLVDGELPMPSVHWTAGAPDRELTLDISAFAIGTPSAAQAVVRYAVRNLSSRSRSVTLALAWRPFQANPPTQFLAHPGGASQIRDIAWDGHVLTLDGSARLIPLVAPSGVRLEPLAAGPASDWLLEPVSGAHTVYVEDGAGFASGVLRFELRLRAGERREIAVAMPTSAGAASVPTMTSIVRDEARVAAHWHDRLDRVRISGPPAVDEVTRTLHSALGHILVNRSGPAIQPGARAYARSWIRDGALTSSALLRLGQEDVARDFLLWFAPFQFKNGKVPCCATVRGADPVPENDSDGEFAFAAAELWHYTHDKATAQTLWPRVRAAIEHMESLRASERGDSNKSPPRRAYFGLMPPSISHEGYSDRPAYSYWDDFWAAIGYRSAVELAQGLGLTEDATRIGAQSKQFVGDLRASLQASTELHHLDVLPGSADRGDVDPTSSTIALSPGGLQGALPDMLVRNTFERYWSDFVARRDGAQSWDAYTPYEWRTVGSLVRLGERERAQQAMAFFYRDRRPPGWNQWAEVVLRNPREPRFLGDMPHGWVESDEIRSVLDLFAYEREGEQGLVLAAGVPIDWLKGPGLHIQGLRTPFGLLGWRARESTVAGREVVEFELEHLRDPPPGGVVLRGPWPKESRVWIDGHSIAAGADEISLPRTPTHVRIELPESVHSSPPAASR